MGPKFVSVLYKKSTKTLLPWTDGSHVGLLNFEDFDKLVLRVRGDGRQYNFVMWSDFDPGLMDQGHQYRAYKAPFQTNGGPTWQKIEIPFSKFLAYQDTKFATHNIHRRNLMHWKRRYIRNIQYLKIELRDDIDGPFQLEIDYIAVAKDKKEQLLDGRMGISQYWEEDLVEAEGNHNSHYRVDGQFGSRFDDKMQKQKHRTSPIGNTVKYWDGGQFQHKV